MVANTLEKSSLELTKVWTRVSASDELKGQGQMLLKTGCLCNVRSETGWFSFTQLPLRGMELVARE